MSDVSYFSDVTEIPTNLSDTSDTSNIPDIEDLARQWSRSEEGSRICVTSEPIHAVLIDDVDSGACVSKTDGSTATKLSVDEGHDPRMKLTGSV